MLRRRGIRTGIGIGRRRRIETRIETDTRIGRKRGTGTGTGREAGAVTQPLRMGLTTRAPTWAAKTTTALN